MTAAEEFEQQADRNAHQAAVSTSERVARMLQGLARLDYEAAARLTGQPSDSPTLAA